MTPLEKLMAMQGPKCMTNLIGYMGKWSMTYEHNTNNYSGNEYKLRTKDHLTPEAAIDALYADLQQVSKGIPELAPMMIAYSAHGEQVSLPREIDPPPSPRNLDDEISF